MSSARRCLLLVALYGSPLLVVSVTARNQTPQALPKLALTAALVLTPEFCATVNKKGHEAFLGGSEKFAVGKTACNELEPALNGVFTSLTRVDDSSKAGGVQLVLEPRFADVGATQRAFAFSKRELVVLVEWTARDQSGKIVWLDTAQGSAKRHIGNAFTYGSNLKHIVEDSVRDMAEQSAAKMSSSPQLLKLSAQPVK
jgi:hypothetical protein